MGASMGGPVQTVFDFDARRVGAGNGVAQGADDGLSSGRSTGSRRTKSWEKLLVSLRWISL